MKKLRVFVAVLLPDDARQQVVEWQQAHPELKVRWKNAKSLHTTVVIPWYASHREIDAAKVALESVARTTQPSFIEIQSVRWGPPSTRKTPHLIWADGVTPREFKELKKRAVKALHADAHTGFHERDKFPTIAHVTVANFVPRPRKSLPPLKSRVHWRFEVMSFQLIESIRTRGGREYRVIASFDFASS